MTYETEVAAKKMPRGWLYAKIDEAESRITAKEMSAIPSNASINSLPFCGAHARNAINAKLRSFRLEDVSEKQSAESWCQMANV